MSQPRKPVVVGSRRPGVRTVLDKVAATGGAGRGLEDFRTAHDKALSVPKRITEGLTALGESWEYEGDFIRRCGLSQMDFAKYREPFLEGHCVVTIGSNSKRIWAGTKKFASKLRGFVS